MKRSGIRNSLALLYAILFLVIVALWGIFYVIVSRYIHSDAEKRIALTAGRIMSDLGSELENLERVVFTLSRSGAAVKFAAEKDSGAYYRLAEEISGLLSGSRYNPEFVSHVIIFNNAGTAYRFSRALSNQSCGKVFRLAGGLDLPDHIIMQSESVSYIGYADGVYDGAGNRTGLVVMLIEEEKIVELISSVVPDDSLLVSMSARGEIIAGGTAEFPQSREGLLVRRHIGVTPFEILVSADEKNINASNHYFTIAAAATAVMFGVLIFLFARILNVRFFSPMLRVMGGVEALDGTVESHRLAPVQSAEFDNLIGTINDMLGRLERRGKEVQAAEIRALNAEIEKHRAIVLSLKKQINTHFLINTLNQVLNRVGAGDAGDAVKMLKDLSSIVQYAFNEDDYVLLWDEFKTLDKYLEILNIRYENRIAWDMDIDDSLMDESMPRMLLQPIVENAAFHGLRNRENIRIDITMRHERGNILISVRDNGQGMAGESLAALREKLDRPMENAPDKVTNIALVNVKRRIVSYFEDNGGLEIVSEAGKGTEVVLSLPLNK